MKKSDIYEITIKILGIYLFTTSINLIKEILVAVESMSIIQMYPDNYGNIDSTPILIFQVFNFIIVILFATLLTFKTKVIVKWVCLPSDYIETSTLFADPKVIYEVALVIMGLLLIIWTIPDFMVKLKLHIQLNQNNPTKSESYTNFLITSAVKIFAGLIATGYSKSIASLIGKDKKNTLNNETELN